MNDDITQSIQEVAQAMAHVNQAFEAYVEELTIAGMDPSEIKRVANNADALKDSGHIYISWARHYAGISDEDSTEDLDEEEGRISGF